MSEANRSGGHTVNVHTTANAVHGENFAKLLNKHAAVVGAHVTGQLRPDESAGMS